MQESGEISSWELRHQVTHILLLLRLPFLFAGFLLGACIWWVTRRLYGDFGGYTALALYCFSPPILKACVAPDPEVFAALAVFGGVYTCIGVAHAMQCSPRKWRPRIVLLAIILGVAASSHIVALPVATLLGLAAMLWIAEGYRSQTLPIVLVASVGALVFLFACYNFSSDAFSYVFRSGAGFIAFSFDPSRRFFSTRSNSGITLAAAAAFVIYLASRRTRYFGNTVPFLCAVFLMALVMTGAPGSPWLWALPFLLTFIGGVFADAFESPHPRLAIGAASAIVLLQIVVCILSLPGLV